MSDASTTSCTTVVEPGVAADRDDVGQHVRHRAGRELHVREHRVPGGPRGHDSGEASVGVQDDDGRAAPGLQGCERVGALAALDTTGPSGRAAPPRSGRRDVGPRARSRSGRRRGD